MTFRVECGVVVSKEYLQDHVISVIGPSRTVKIDTITCLPVRKLTLFLIRNALVFMVLVQFVCRDQCHHLLTHRM